MVPGLLVAPLWVAVLGPGLVPHAFSGQSGFLMGLLCDISLGTSQDLKEKSIERFLMSSLDISSISVKHERPQSAKLESRSSCTYLVAFGGRRGREGRSSLPLLLVLAEDPDATGLCSLQRLFSV